MMVKKMEKQAVSSGKNKKSVNDRFEFRWVDRPAEQFSPPRSRHRGYADPTADAAIGNIIREKKRRKRVDARRKKRKRNRNGNREGKDAGSSC